MEQKLDMLIEMMAGMNEKMTSMQEDMTTMKHDIHDLKKMKPIVEATQHHVANIGERLTMTQNIKKLYSEEALKAVEAV